MAEDKDLNCTKILEMFKNDPSILSKHLRSVAKRQNADMRAHHKKAFERRRARIDARSEPSQVEAKSLPQRKNKSTCSGYLCSVQVNLSRLKGMVSGTAKRHSKMKNETECMNILQTAYLNKLCLSAEECRSVRTHRSARVEVAGESVVTIKGDQYVRKARALLDYVVKTRSDPFEAVVALAILTGRRSSEILRSISVRSPLYINAQNPRSTHEQYWASMRGFLKHKPGVRIRRDIPLLGSRHSIVRGLKYVRDRLPSTGVQNCNSRYSTQINRRVKNLCGELKTLHTARRLYALMCHHYFKSDINPGETMSLPRVVAYVLGHTNLSKTSLTYMNIDLDDACLRGLDFTVCP